MIRRACLIAALVISWASAAAAQVTIGTTISGTYQQGPGYTNSSHLFYAVNAGVWWYLTVSSTSDSAGNPGTHVIKSYVSSGSNLATATWSASTDSPNMDASNGTGNGTALIGGPSGISAGGRGLACQYLNNSGGSNKDRVVCFMVAYGTNNAGGGNATDSWDGIIDATITSNSITWGTWGGWETQQWNNIANHPVQAGNAIGITTDGYLQIAGCVFQSELDASVASSIDPLGDTWTTGLLTATANTTSGQRTVTSMSSQTNFKIEMGISVTGTDWTSSAPVVRYPETVSIDSSTQVSVRSGTTATTTTTGASARWWQFTMGTTRIDTVVDNTMANESTVHGLAPLAAGGMLYIYDTGLVAPPNFQNLKSIKANQTHGQGFWPSTLDGTGSAAVFGSSVTADAQDWGLAAVDTTHIYVCRVTATTTANCVSYSTGGNSWSALTNQPATLSGKAFKAGAGLVPITDGTDFWLFAIDGTNNQIIYSKFSVGAGTWGAWTVLATVSSTATMLSGYPKQGAQQLAVVYSITNGSNFDTQVVALSTAVVGTTLLRMLLGVGGLLAAVSLPRLIRR